MAHGGVTLNRRSVVRWLVFPLALALGSLRSLAPAHYGEEPTPVRTNGCSLIWYGGDLYDCIVYQCNDCSVWISIDPVTHIQTVRCVCPPGQGGGPNPA